MISAGVLNATTPVPHRRRIGNGDARRSLPATINRLALSLAVSPRQILTQYGIASGHADSPRPGYRDQAVVALQRLHGFIDGGLGREETRRGVVHQRHAAVSQVAETARRRFPAGDLVEHDRPAHLSRKFSQQIEILQAIDQDRVRAGLFERYRPAQPLLRFHRVRACHHDHVPPDGKHLAKFDQVILQFQNLLAAYMPAAAGASLVLQDHGRRPGRFQYRDHVRCHLGVAVTIIDVHDDMVLRQHGADTLQKRHDVRPGDKPYVRQPVVAGGKPEPAQENPVEVPRGQRGRENVIHPDEAQNVPRRHLAPQ